MINIRRTISISGVTLFLAFVPFPATGQAGDLSKYRNFQLGMDLPAVVKQAGASTDQVRVIHSRPALIQELEWRPQSLGQSSQTEAAQKVIFGFYNGELFQIEVDYDRYDTEGLTTEDLIDTISGKYGQAEISKAPAKKESNNYGDHDETVAQWQDPQYRFELIRSSYGPTFKLVGVVKKLEDPVKVADLEAKRLDEQDAPQREAARLATDEATQKTKLEKARLLNKPKFRP